MYWVLNKDKKYITLENKKIHIPEVTYILKLNKNPPNNFRNFTFYTDLDDTDSLYVTEAIFNTQNGQIENEKKKLMQRNPYEWHSEDIIKTLDKYIISHELPKLNLFIKKKLCKLAIHLDENTIEIENKRIIESYKILKKIILYSISICSYVISYIILKFIFSGEHSGADSEVRLFAFLFFFGIPLFISNRFYNYFKDKVFRLGIIKK